MGCHKRRRIQPTPVIPNPSECPGRDRLSALPLELLALILSYVLPRDVLALSRSSRNFCSTLVNPPHTDFIWRHARLACPPKPPPDPTPNFTEASYAAFLFDGGVCEKCGKETDHFYESFSLRLRICNERSCFPDWLRAHGYKSDRRTGKLVLESVPIPGSESDNATYFRKSDWESVLGTSSISTWNEHVKVPSWDVRRLQLIRQHCAELVEWRDETLAHLDMVVKNSARICDSFARRQGWKPHDLRNSSTFRAFVSMKKRRMEGITIQDLQTSCIAVGLEIAQAEHRRRRRDEERAYRERRDEVALFYQEMRRTRADAILPPLPLFRSLPVIHSLQDKMDRPPGEITRLLETSAEELVLDNLKAWQDEMQKKFSARLGYPSAREVGAWDPSVSRGLHPVYRATARFICLKCTRDGPRDGVEVGLSFKEACCHRCPGLDRQGRRAESWYPNQFAPDAKAIKVIKRLVSLLNYSDDTVTIEELSRLGDRILCKSCEGTIIMNYATLIQHCIRHDDMQIDVLDHPAAQRVLQHTIAYGLTTDLMSKKKCSERKRQQRIYGCRHCSQLDASHSAEGSMIIQVEEEPSEMPSQSTIVAGKPKLTCFDGMRSHLKARHGVQSIRDEDYFAVNIAR